MNREKTTFTAWATKLPSCVNRDMIDKAAEDFCSMNTKGNRRRLVQLVTQIPNSSLYLIPYYCRLVAVLHSALPDIGTAIVERLVTSFKGVSRHQEDHLFHLESRIRTARMLGELTKFRVCPPNVTLNCFRVLLDDFTHHNIDVACHLLESCGRFLFVSPESRIRMTNLVLSLDLFYFRLFLRVV